MELVLPAEEAFEKFFIEHESVKDWEETVLIVAERGAREALAKEKPLREDDWERLELPKETAEELESLGYKTEIEVRDISIKKEE